MNLRTCYFIFFGLGLSFAEEIPGRCESWIECSGPCEDTDRIKIVTQVDIPKAAKRGKIRHEYSFGDSCEKPEIDEVYTDCRDIPSADPKDSGIYQIRVDGLVVPVYCEIRSDGLKYLIFQRRFDGSVDFYRTWDEYQNGFGNISGEFWLGNILLHKLTSRTNYKLRIELEAFDSKTAFAQYNQFAIGSNVSQYHLTISGYSGNAGDSLAYHNGKKFTTKDRRNDDYAPNCAIINKGAWWYSSCHYSNLNGFYHKGVHASFVDGINWQSFKGYYESMKATKMMIFRN